MRCRFPVIEVDDILIAVLLCETSDEHIGLFLHPAPGYETQDPMRRIYYAGYAFITTEARDGESYRLVTLGNDLYNLRFRGKTYQARWRDLYIHASPRETDEADPARRLLLFGPDGIPDTPFRVPRWLIGALSALRIPPTDNGDIETVDGLPRVWVDFADVVALEGIRLWLGLARPPADAGVDGDAPLAQHWAWAEPAHRENWNDDAWLEHTVAPADFVARWPGRARDFGDAARTIHLSFAPCAHAPETTLVLHIELRGSVYEKMQSEAGLVIPPRAALVRLPPDAETPLVEIVVDAPAVPAATVLEDAPSSPDKANGNATNASSLPFSQSPLQIAGTDLRHEKDGPEDSLRVMLHRVLRPAQDDVVGMVRTMLVAVVTVLVCRFVGL